MKKKVVFSTILMILGLGVLFSSLIFAEGGSKNINKKGSINKNSNLVITKEITKKIDEAKSNGFDVALPEQVPDEASYVVNTSNKKFENGVELNLTQFGSKEDGNNEKWKLQIMQEKLLEGDSKETAVKFIEEEYGKNRKLEKLFIQNNPAYIHIRPEKEKGLDTLWIVTDKYFYTITSPKLTKEELKSITESMKLK